MAWFSASLGKIMTSALLIGSLAAISQPAEQIAPAALPLKSDSATYLASYWHNGVGLVSRPFHWNKEQWLAAGGTMVFSLSVIFLDDALNQTIIGWNDETAQKFGDWGNTAGGIPVQFGISAAAAAVGAIAKNKSIVHFGLDNLQAQAFTAGLALIVKNLTHRPRPETGESPYVWHGPFSGWGNDSYFSGHTALAYCTANMLFLHSGKKWWVGILGFGTATAVGLSRMQQQKHWASDVVMGAVVGSAVSTYVYKQQEKRRMVRSTIKKLP